ncbi:hypothetical protein [Helicobacter marmotae]|uniref:DUF342 domain-containing protein n=1 Tax=Helicobacter marmotae TaxID=152490 RepID=A0A3D8I307_9HELI|nr:hypothetical protein [Helicobacter marmotae]RDU59366.1 hypothetical protein CQA63_06920 [Helicobacter marmotae]
MQLFEPISIKACPDVKAEIKKICEMYAIEEQMVSFDILQINTLYRGEKKKDFSILTPEECEQILGDEAKYNQNDFELKQVYDVVLRGLKEGDLAPFVALNVDSECYELSLELKKGLEIGDDEGFFNELYAQITRAKVLERVVVRIFGDKTAQEIQALRELFQSLEISGKLEATRSFVIAKAGGYTPSMNSHFKFILQEEWNASHIPSVDFASFAAKSGELVGLGFKAQEGVSGRNLRGEYVNVKKEKRESQAQLRCKEEEFRMEEKSDVIEYYALQDSYVSLGEGELKMIIDFHLPEVSLRKSGSLLGGDKKGFVLEVACADPNQDAIGAGIVLEAADVKIYGSVAENAKIIAHKVEINGQTHQSSVVQAQEVNIDIHKGKALGEKVHINRLELGNIEGEEVFIEQANGGNVRAKDIVIGTLHSHTNLTLSHSLHITNISGGENQITISSRASLKTQEEVQHINASLEHNFQLMNSLLSVLSKDLALVRRTKPVIEKIKVIIEDNKKNNKPNERNITDSIAEYVILLRRAKYLKERLLELQKESKDLNAILEHLDKQTKEASIVADSPWQGENEIIYESFFPEIKDVLLLSDGESADIHIEQNQHKLQKVERAQ